MLVGRGDRSVDDGAVDLEGAVDAVRALGRTEDLAFAPGGARLAFAAYTRESIGVVELGDRGRVETVELPTPAVRRPHGLAFVTDEVVVVANRMGGLTFLALESAGDGGAATAVRPLDVGGRGLALLDRCGSVTAVPAADGVVEVIACQNRANTVTSHRVRLADAGVEVLDNRVLLSGGLDVPDGVAVQGEVIAVSNHFRHVIVVHERDGDGADPVPCAVLLGCVFPHGLAFTADGRVLVAADAGGAFVHVYERPGDSWRGTCRPTRSLRVVSDEVIAAAGYDEGGPKGVDISPDGRWLAITGENVPLRLVELASLLDGRLGEPYDAEADLRYEHGRLAAADHRNAVLVAAEARARRRPARLASRTWGRVGYEASRVLRRIRR